jgi:signal transduction histidine kinase
LHGEAEEIFLKSYNDNSWVWIEYSDNATKKVLQNPNELGLKLQPSKKGSGLGLYIVRRWMQAQKAMIEFSQSEKHTLVVKMRFLKSGGPS